MRRCKIAPAGCTRPGKPCCVDCKDKTCQARCWNDPKHCGCWENDPPPRRGTPRRIDWDKVHQLHKDGLSRLKIAAELGISLQSVNNILRKAEVDRHGNS